MANHTDTPAAPVTERMRQAAKLLDQAGELLGGPDQTKLRRMADQLRDAAKAETRE